jgi:hypothetical protein
MPLNDPLFDAALWSAVIVAWTAFGALVIYRLRMRKEQ